MEKKAQALLSGGLGSSLAVKMILDQGIAVTAVNFVSPFCNCTSRNAGCKHQARKVAEVDCRIYMLRKVREMIPDEGSFVVTGEVLGQRPMSQHRQAINTIEQESGLRILEGHGRCSAASHLRMRALKLRE